MAKEQGHWGVKRVGGVALMLIGVALIGYGAHYLAENGTCSGTGYASFGPVPKCSGGEALYITSAFFLGPLVALVGWLMAQLWGTLWPAVCLALGTGLGTISADPRAAPGAQAFGLVTGVCFGALAVVSVTITLRKRSNRGKAQAGLAGPPYAPAGMGTVPAVGVSSFRPAAPGAKLTATGSGLDPLDKIAKLAQLRDSGALTEAEFEREKAKLLGQI